MTRVAWFHCFAGIAGDMALGALLDAGADEGEVRALLGRLDAPGWQLGTERTQRAGLAATRAVVTAPDAGQPERHLADLEQMVADATLPPRTEARAMAVFRALAEAEARVHGVGIDQVHFHEVGALDAVVDVVGTCAALEVLGVDEVHAGPVAVGVGTIRASHGTLPNPGPAVVALLAGAPSYGVDVDVELTTPTGAALLAALCRGWGPQPAMTVAAVGYGAGRRDLADRPNVTQVVIGDTTSLPPLGAGQPVVQLEVNVDDVSGEVLAHTVGALLGAGAHDAWVTPIVMKKGRPAHTVHALVDPARADVVARVLLAESGSLGLRAHRLERWPQARVEQVVTIEGHAVRLKVGSARVKVEHDDAAAAAAALGLPLREVLHRAEQQARATGTAETGPTGPNPRSEGSTA